MALLDDINMTLRDFEVVSTAHPAPTGDPASGVHNLRKHDLRQLLKTIAQTMGDPDALQDILTELQGKADAAAVDLKADAATANVLSRFVPVVAAGGNVPLWLEGGLLGARGLAPSLASAVLDGISASVNVGQRVPLVVAGDKVMLWIDAEGLKGPGIGASDRPQLSAPPLATDGRTLHRLKSKIARIKTGGTGESARLRIATMGDSWADLATIPTVLRTLLDDKLGLLGEGWQSVMGNTQIGGVTFTKSAGWVVTDASQSVSDWPLGAGPDGHLISTGASSETVVIGDLRATEIRIYSRNHGGTWRYRVDGAAWQTVAENTSGALRITTITGLADAAHTLNIDTAGNTGTVVIAGFYSTRQGAGAELLKMGNAGLRGSNIPAFAPFIAPYATNLRPDAVICFLGTNDYRSAISPPAAYIEGISAMAAALRNAVPDVGLIFVSPSRSDPTGQAVPLDTYRDALRDWCAANDAEFLNLTDQLGTYAQTEPLGMWADTVHMSAAGAEAIVRIINQNFLHL